MDEQHQGNAFQYGGGMPVEPKINPAKPGATKKVILSIVILFIIALLTIYFTSRGNIQDVPVKQLQMIKAGDLQNAYDITSKNFKEATTYEIFEAYVNSSTVLKDFKTLTLNKADEKITGTTAYLKGVLEGEDGGKMNAEYELVNEDGKWKIEAIRLIPIGLDTSTSEAPMQTTDNGGTTTTTTQTTGPVIHGIMINDTADTDGYVQETKSTIPRSASKIFVTVMIVAPVPDINVSASLKHVPSGAVLGPIESKTSKTGNIMKAFSFTRDKQLWPAGEYEIDVKLSTGASQSLKFEIH